MAKALPMGEALDTEVTGRRVVQHVLDVLISTLMVLPLTVFAGIGADSGSGTAAWTELAGLLYGLVALLWYWVLRPVGTGQTWGMRLLGIRVVRTDRSPLTTRDVVTRLLLLVVDGPVGLLVMCVSPRRQRLGDMVAGTLVVRDRRPHRAYGGAAVGLPGQRGIR